MNVPLSACTGWSPVSNMKEIYREIFEKGPFLYQIGCVNSGVLIHIKRPKVSRKVNMGSHSHNLPMILH